MNAHDLVEELVAHLRGAWRFRRTAVIAAYCVALVGWATVLVLPDSYEASARVFINTSTALKPLLQGLAVDQDTDAQLNMVRESLLGRARLQRVIRDADLDIKANTPEKLDRLISDLQKTIDIHALSSAAPGQESRSGDSVYTITYRHADRTKALAVVRSLLGALMEDMVSGKRAGADTAQKFLGDQIKEYEQRLSDAEGKLADFKKRNVGLVPGEQGDYFSRLQAEMLASKKAESALDVAMHRRVELERQLRGEKPFAPGSTVTGSLNTLPMVRQSGATSGGDDTASRIAETQAKLDDLLLRFTDKHPDVLALKETLAQLKMRQAAELEALKRGDTAAAATSGLSANPLYQNIQLQLNQVDVEIAALRGELADHQRAEAELRRVASTAPEIEAEYSRLTRDYNVEKAQYQALVERLDKAKLSQDAADTGIVQFQIINPPTADAQPVAPHRAVLACLVLVLALAAGVGLAWAISELRPVFTTARGLTEATGIPLLGAIHRVRVNEHRARVRQELVQVGSAIGGLIVVFLIVAVFNHAGARVMHVVLPFTAGGT